MLSDLPRFPAGGVYIYALPRVRIHRLPLLTRGRRFQSQLFTAYRTTQPCHQGTHPPPARDLSAPAHKKVAVYFRRYTVINVYYARYKLVHLAFAELTPSSHCLPFHNLEIDALRAFIKNTCFSPHAHGVGNWRMHFCTCAQRVRVCHITMKLGTLMFCNKSSSICFKQRQAITIYKLCSL